MAERRAARWGAVLTAVVALAVAAPTLRYRLVFDDHYLVEADGRLARIEAWPSLFTSSWPRGWERYGYYRPLTALSFALERAVWRNRPAGLHSTNLALHAADSVLAYEVLGEVLAWGGIVSPAAALAGGVVFALHPLHAEAAAWVAGGRTQLLPAFFVLLAMLLWARRRRGWGVFFWGLGLLSGEPAAPLFALFFLWEWLRPRSWEDVGRAARPGAVAWVALVLVGWGYAMLRRYVLGAVLRPEGDVSSIAPIAVSARLGELWDLARASVLPSVLAPLSVMAGGGRGAAVAGVLLLVALGLGVTLLKRWLPRLFFLLAWIVVFLLPLVPVVVPLYPWEISARHLYLSAFGGAGLAALGVELLLGRIELRSRTVPALLGVAGVLAVVFVLTERPWRDDVALWRAVEGARVNRVLARKNLGRSLCVAGHPHEGLVALRTARDLPGTFSPVRLAQSFFWEAECVRLEGEPEQARLILEAALGWLSEHGAEGRQLGPFHERLGALRLEKADREGALKEFMKAMEADPEPNLALLEIVENGSPAEQVEGCGRAGLSSPGCARFAGWALTLPRDVLMELPLLGIRAW